MGMAGCVVLGGGVVVVTGPLGPFKVKGLSLVRTKETGAPPTAVAVAVYWPAVPLAVAFTAACPSAMTAAADERVAEAPFAGVTAKLTTPPATGSTGFLAVTVTVSGFAKGLPSSADCGVLPETGVIVKPWLWKAPISIPCAEHGFPRWSVVGTLFPATPPPIAGLPGRRAMVEVGPP